MLNRLRSKFEKLKAEEKETDVNVKEEEFEFKVSFFDTLSNPV